MDQLITDTLNGIRQWLNRHFIDLAVWDSRSINPMVTNPNISGALLANHYSEHDTANALALSDRHLPPVPYIHRVLCPVGGDIEMVAHIQIDITDDSYLLWAAYDQTNYDNNCERYNKPLFGKIDHRPRLFPLNDPDSLSRFGKFIFGCVY